MLRNLKGLIAKSLGRPTKQNCSCRGISKTNLLALAEKVIPDTYHPVPKILNLVDVYASNVRPARLDLIPVKSSFGEHIDITNLMNYTNMNSYDLFKHLYISLMNLKYQQNNSQQYFCESDFDKVFNFNYMRQLFGEDYKIGTVNNLQFDIWFRKPANIQNLKDLSTPHAYFPLHGQYMNIEVFDKEHGKDSLHQILLQKLVQHERNQYKGHDSIRNIATFTTIQNQAEKIVAAKSIGSAGVGPKLAVSILIEEFVSNSIFVNNDTRVEITQLMNKYDIPSWELFHTMYHPVGSFDMGKWAHENGCEWTSQTCANAALGGHTEVLKWARENGCEWTSQTCANAAAYGHLEILKWAYQNNCPWFYHACARAASNEHLEVLKWALLENNFPCDDMTRTYIAKKWPDVFGHF